MNVIQFLMVPWVLAVVFGGVRRITVRLTSISTVMQTTESTVDDILKAVER